MPDWKFDDDLRPRAEFWSSAVFWALCGLCCAGIIGGVIGVLLVLEGVF